MEGQLKFADALSDRNRLRGELVNIEEPLSEWRASTTVRDFLRGPEASRPWLSRSHSVLTSPSLDGQSTFPRSSEVDTTYRRRASSASATWASNGAEAAAPTVPMVASALPATEKRTSLWKSPWGNLLRLHVVIILLLWWAVFIGSTFARRKWSQLSPRLHRIPYDRIETGPGLDFEIARRLLSTEDLGSGATVQDVVGPSLLEEARHVSIYVLGDDKRAYKLRKKQDPLYALAAFSEVLLCSSFQWDTPSHLRSHSGSTCPYSQPSQLRTHEGYCDSQAFIQTPQSYTVLEYKPIPWLRMKRTCVYWNTDDLSTIPPLIESSAGLLTPNYPLEALIETFVRNPLLSLTIVGLAWCHSLYAAQSWTVIHVPRLLTYVAWGIWRAVVLYSFLGGVEKLPWVQRFLRDLDTSGAKTVDFSDHIVLYTTLCFVLSTELFCLWRFKVMSQESKRSQESWEPAARSLTTEFESPALLASVVLYALTVIDVMIILLLMYATLVTSAFYHTPLEAYVGFGIGTLGTFGLFYAILLFIDEKLMPRRYFGLSVHE